MGGILGMAGGVITSVYMDVDTITDRTRAIYKPNIIILNRQITRWSENGIIFAGIFHTHPFNQHTLSEDDNQYIKQIMEAMPQSVNSLFFPVVIPNHEIYSYYAKRDLKETKIAIYADTIKLI